MNPEELRYSEQHEWLRLESDDRAVIGITEFAADSLGDVVFVELAEVGTELSQFNKMGEIESVKAVSELFTPVSGRVAERNDQLTDNPELVNDGPYDSGWMLKMELTDRAELDSLMSSDKYEAFVESQEQ